MDSPTLAGLIWDYSVRVSQHRLGYTFPSGASIFDAVHTAAQTARTCPLVYNTGGYDTRQSPLRMLDGVVTSTCPTSSLSIPTSQAHGGRTPTILMSCELPSEIHRQVGDLQINDQGIATRGLLVAICHAGRSRRDSSR